MHIRQTLAKSWAALEERHLAVPMHVLFLQHYRVIAYLEEAALEVLLLLDVGRLTWLPLIFRAVCFIHPML